MKIFELHDTITYEHLGTVCFIPAHSEGGLNPTPWEIDLLRKEWINFEKRIKSVEEFVSSFNGCHKVQIDTVETEDLPNKKMQPNYIDTYILPSHFASALVNGDYSGIAPEDEVELRAWLHSTKPGYCVGCSDESCFKHGHDMDKNQGADVLEFYFDNRDHKNEEHG